MPDKYLSLDPLAGMPVGDSRYLSVDPDAGEADVRQPSGGPANTTSTAIGVPAAVLAGNGLAAGAMRAGMELATHPAVDRLASRVAGPLASRAAGSAVGAVVGGFPGAVVGSELGRAAAPMARRALPAVVQGSGGLLARLGALAGRVAGPVGVITSALTADTQPTSGPVADQALQQQRVREAIFRQQHPDYQRATDVDLPRELPNTRSIAQREYQRLKGTK